jgi:ribonuclease P protein component
LLRSGQKLKARLVDARRLESSQGHARVALIVPKFGFTIVRRNKVKRRLRELVRQLLLPRPCSCDLVLRARREAYSASFERLRDDVNQIAGQMAT